MADWTEKHIQRRTTSFSGFRLDGLADLLPRAYPRTAPGASVFDVGCNRGAVLYDFLLAGATTLHGCDISKDTIRTANEWFADFRHVEARFEVVDLTGGAGALKKAFGEHYRKEYDITLMLAVYHKLRRQMPLERLLHLVDHLAHHTGKFFVWRGDDPQLPEFEPTLLAKGFTRVHYSKIYELKLPENTDIVRQPAAIWAKN